MYVAALAMLTRTARYEELPSHAATHALDIDPSCLQIHKDHDCKPQSYIKEPSDTVDTKAEPLLETYKLDTYVQVKQELIASAATGVDTNPALQLSSEPTATHKSAYAALVSEERPMQPVVMLELEPDDAEPSARAPTCLDDAQRLAHASLEIQSYQFPFLVAKVQTYLAVRTLLDAAETREIAQALEIAACIGATVASRTPSEPALTELLRTIHKFYALAGDHAVLMATAYVSYRSVSQSLCVVHLQLTLFALCSFSHTHRNMAKFAASWRPHAHTPDAAEGDDAVIRMDL